MHLSALALGVIGLPDGSLAMFSGPLLVSLFQRHKSTFVDDQFREALNFNITLFAAALMCVPIGLLTGLPGRAALLPVGIAWFAMTALAVYKAARGEWYRYPVSVRFLMK